MAGASFSTKPAASSWRPVWATTPAPKPAKPVGAGLNTPSQIGAGAGLLGLHAPPAPPGFSGYGNGPTSTPQQAGNSPAAPAASPYDSQYYIDLGDATRTANNTIAGYQQSIGDARTNLQGTYAELARQLAIQQTNEQNAENQAGGFGVGALGTRIANNSAAEQYRHDTAGRAEQAQEDQWNTAIAGVQQGLSTEQIALGMAAADRRSKLGIGTPASSSGGGGATTSQPGTPATGASSPAKSGGAALSGVSIKAGHPNWYGPGKPPAPLSGAAIRANHPNW